MSTHAAATGAVAEVLRVLRDADHCHGLVTRDGEQDACGKPPVALIDAREFEDGCIWPACAWHANRYGVRWVSLADIYRATQPPPSAREGER